MNNELEGLWSWREVVWMLILSTRTARTEEWSLTQYLNKYFHTICEMEELVSALTVKTKRIQSPPYVSYLRKAWAIEASGTELKREGVRKFPVSNVLALIE